MNTMTGRYALGMEEQYLTRLRNIKTAKKRTLRPHYSLDGRTVISTPPTGATVGRCTRWISRKLLPNCRLKVCYRAFNY